MINCFTTVLIVISLGWMAGPEKAGGWRRKQRDAPVKA